MSGHWKLVGRDLRVKINQKIKSYAVFSSLCQPQTLSAEFSHILHGPATTPMVPAPTGRAEQNRANIPFQFQLQVQAFGLRKYCLQPGGGSNFMLFELSGLSHVSLYKFSGLPSPVCPIIGIKFPLFAIRESLPFLTEL